MISLFTREDRLTPCLFVRFILFWMNFFIGISDRELLPAWQPLL